MLQSHSNDEQPADKRRHSDFLKGVDPQMAQTITDEIIDRWGTLSNKLLLYMLPCSGPAVCLDDVGK